MKRLPKIQMGIAAGLGLCATAYLLSGSRVEAPVPEVNARPGERPTPPERSTPPVEITALKDELVKLRSEMSAIRSQVAASRGGSDPASQTQPAARDPRTDEDARAEAEARRREYMAKVESTFFMESDDPAWSLDTTALLREALATHAVALASARNIECRSNTCRVELADDGTGALSKFLPLFAQRVGGVLPEVAADRVEDEHGRFTTVLYLSRRR